MRAVFSLPQGRSSTVRKREIAADFAPNSKEMKKCLGYPVSDFEQRSANISIDHPLALENYRAAPQSGLRQTQGKVGTEDLRKAMIHYRMLFEELIREPEPARL